MEKQINIDELQQFLATQSSESRVYIGGDSEKLLIRGQWYADYTTVVVVHIDGCRGCRIFGQIERERVYDAKMNKPTMRLMTEVQKVSEMYLRIQPLVERFHTEIHLDLNAKKLYGSNHVVQQAVGYIRGVCGIEPQIKPDAFSASYAADRYKEICAFAVHKPSPANIRGIQKYAAPAA